MLDRVARSAWRACTPRSRIRAITSRGFSDPATSSATWTSSANSPSGSAGCGVGATAMVFSGVHYDSAARVQPDKVAHRFPHAGALAGREGEERIALAGFRVLLEPLDDQPPVVVDRTEVILRDRRGPVGVPEGDAGLALLRRGDLPAHRGLVPVRKIVQTGPLHALARNQLIDPHPLGGAAKAEGGDRADLRFGFAVRSPERLKTVLGRAPLVNLFG